MCAYECMLTLLSLTHSACVNDWDYENTIIMIVSIADKCTFKHILNTLRDSNTVWDDQFRLVSLIKMIDKIISLDLWTILESVWINECERMIWCNWKSEIKNTECRRII